MAKKIVPPGPDYTEAPEALRHKNHPTVPPSKFVLSSESNASLHELNRLHNALEEAQRKDTPALVNAPIRPIVPNASPAAAELMRIAAAEAAAREAAKKG